MHRYDLSFDSSAYAGVGAYTDRNGKRSMLPEICERERDEKKMVKEFLQFGEFENPEISDDCDF